MAYSLCLLTNEHTCIILSNPTIRTCRLILAATAFKFKAVFIDHYFKNIKHEIYKMGEPDGHCPDPYTSNGL